jgi:hypothetical protein
MLQLVNNFLGGVDVVSLGSKFEHFEVQKC